MGYDIAVTIAHYRIIVFMEITYIERMILEGY